MEGDPKTLFSSVCNVGDEQSIISGRVPERFSYESPRGEPFSCRIQKQDEGEGDFKVILLADDTTHSIQQTSKKGDTITVSYKHLKTSATFLSSQLPGTTSRGGPEALGSSFFARTSSHSPVQWPSKYRVGW